MNDLAKIFKALSDENRLTIFQLIRDSGPGCEMSEEQAGQCVTEIAENFDLALSTVSHHLKELKNAGLIICEKRGQRVHCRVNEEVLRIIEDFVETAA